MFRVHHERDTRNPHVLVMAKYRTPHAGYRHVGSNFRAAARSKLPPLRLAASGIDGLFLQIFPPGELPALEVLVAHSLLLFALDCAPNALKHTIANYASYGIVVCVL